MMGSTVTPLKRQRSVKFHIDESSAKPSIKITVSSDALAETLLKNNVSSSSNTTVMENEEASSNNGSANQQQPALIQIVGNCCATSGGGDGVHNPPSNGVLCTCANGDDKRTRIALDDFTVLEFPNCIDFGIKDFLCCRDEIELDLSSDTDASYLDATPPHRFSDSELDNQIEAMSITLDTQLNPFPKNTFLVKSTIDPDDDEEEETTEESFIMDEEEVSSSASNSAATICVDGVDLDQDDHLSVSSSELLMQGESQQSMQTNVDNNATIQSISATNEAGKAQSLSTHISNDVDINSVGVPKPKGLKGKENNECSVGESIDNSKIITASVVVTRARHKLETLNSADSHEENSAVGKELENVCHVDDGGSEQILASKGKNGTILHRELPISRKVLQHPTKHFRRQISLPASIFMSYLLEQNNKANYGKQQSSDAKMNHQNEEHQDQHNNSDIIAKNKLNRSNSCNKKSTKSCNSIMPSLTPLSKIDSYRSAKVIHGSTEDYEYDDMNISSTCNEANDEYSGGAMEISHESDTANEHDDRDSSLLLNCTLDDASWAWESKSDSFPEQDDSNDADFDDEQQALTSEVEKRSLILRHVRRLIRQDTTGNFAPPDFSI